MSIVVIVSDEGQEKMYFRINSYNGDTVVERPDKSTIYAPTVGDAETLTEQIILALEAIKEEDDKWTTLNEAPLGVMYPRLRDLDS